jgi:hypothetical protein
MRHTIDSTYDTPPHTCSFSQCRPFLALDLDDGAIRIRHEEQRLVRVRQDRLNRRNLLLRDRVAGLREPLAISERADHLVRLASALEYRRADSVHALLRRRDVGHHQADMREGVWDPDARGQVPVGVLKARDLNQALDIVLVAVHLLRGLVTCAVTAAVRVTHVADGEVLRDLQAEYEAQTKGLRVPPDGLSGVAGVDAEVVDEVAGRDGVGWHVVTWDCNRVRCRVGGLCCLTGVECTCLGRANAVEGHEQCLKKVDK